jgi:hypothetical protein
MIPMAKPDQFPTTSTPVALPDEERQRIEAAIQEHLDEAERLVGRLDASEADPDLEDNGDSEPDQDGETDLGWPEMLNQTKAIRSCAGWEAANDLEQDTADDEPSLGSPLAAMHDQTRWTAGRSADLEQDCEDEGADEGAEYVTSLGRYIPPQRPPPATPSVVG